MRMPNALLDAIRFLTIVRVRDTESAMAPDWLARAMKYFPAVGAGIGLCSAIVMLLANEFFSPVIAALLAVTTSIVITSALHEDGLADTADSFGGGWSVEKRLAIMKDSRIGTFGALALGIGVALRVVAVSDMPMWAGPAALIAAHAAAPMLVARPGGLMIFTSAPGAVSYAHGPAYGAQKAGTDKMSADMAVELRPFGVASVCIWMGFLKTARTAAAVAERPGQFDAIMQMAETPDFTGRVIAAIHRDPNMMALSGRTVIGAEQAKEYGVRDLDGSSPGSLRDIVGNPVTYDTIILD